MSIFGIASSGLQAAGAQLNVAANNIANLNTPNYQTQRADLVSAPDDDGVEVAGVQSTDVPNDPANAMIALRQAKLFYGANALVVKTADQMYGSLLNVLDNQDQHSN